MRYTVRNPKKPEPWTEDTVRSLGIETARDSSGELAPVYDLDDAAVTNLQRRGFVVEPVSEPVTAPTRPSVLDEIAAERAGQVAKGYDAAHDDEHTTFEISAVAAAVALGGSEFVSFDVPEWADTIIAKHDTRQRMIIAAALLVAEIERLDRKQK